MNNKWQLIIIPLISLLVFSTCTKKEPDVIKNGAVLPLTAPSGQYGKWIKEWHFIR